MRRSLPPLLALVALSSGPLVAVIPSAAAAPIADNYPRNPNVDVVHYAFHLTLSDDTDEIAGRADITVRFVSSGVREFALDLVDRDEDGRAAMSVTGVSRGGDAVGFSHTDDRLTISMATPSQAGERRTYRVEYRGVPANGLIIDQNRHGERTFFGDNWPNRARNWLPTVDHVSDKATVEWIVVAPNHYQVIGNGAMVESTDLPDGTRLTHWKTRVPIPTKVMVIGAARFAVQRVGEVDGVPVESWVYPQDRDAGFYDYALAEKVLRFFTGHIGPFPYAKLANVQSKTRYGGMENASNIFYSERSVSGTRRGEGLIAHEVAHQWFGDSITENDWHHVWLSEGFATYFAQLYTEFTYGRDRLVQGMQRNRDTVIRFYRQNPELAVVAPSIADLNDLLNRNSYQKGGWVLHMLRRQVGDEAFWEGIRSYYRTYRDKNALTEDFQRAMEQVSGQDLETFFHQWIFEPGHPTLEATWSYDASAQRLSVTVEQTQQTATLFSTPLDIGIVLPGGGVRVETMQLDGASQTAGFDADTEPTEIVLDPDTWLLFEGEVTRRR